LTWPSVEEEPVIRTGRICSVEDFSEQPQQRPADLSALPGLPLPHGSMAIFDIAFKYLYHFTSKDAESVQQRHQARMDLCSERAFHSKILDITGMPSSS
jgi:hypothetical protein